MSLLSAKNLKTDSPSPRCHDFNTTFFVAAQKNGPISILIIHVFAKNDICETVFKLFLNARKSVDVDSNSTEDVRNQHIA